MNYFSPFANDQIFDANGNPLNAGKVYTYLAGTSTPATTYTTQSGSTAQANPIILNSLGYVANPIWLASGVNYKIVIADSTDVILKTVDNVSGVNNVSVPLDQWIAFTGTPTYIGATQFSVTGDQTGTFSVGRRTKTTNSGGTIYSTITASSYGAGITTVTVANDSGGLDSGLSAVSYGVLTYVNTGMPKAQSAINADNVTGTIANGVTATTQAANDNSTKVATTAYVVGQAGSSTPQALGTAAVGTSLKYSREDHVHANPFVSGTTQNTTSGTSIDFTSIPSTVKRITVMIKSVSTNGSSVPLIQLGSGSVDATSYIGVTGNRSAETTYSTGFALVQNISSTQSISGIVTLALQGSNVWVASIVMGFDAGGNSPAFGGGNKTLSGTLDRIRLTTTNGTDTFDAGSINILME